ncbi:MAG TPA: DUF4265 domain-containing protein [Micromonosporaceae bacterium]
MAAAVVAIPHKTIVQEARPGADIEHRAAASVGGDMGESEMKYIVHESPVGRSNQNHIAMVDLSPFGFRNLMEQLWLTPLGEKKYQVSCIPFRVYGMALNDIVELDSTARHVKSVVGRSGHRAFRVFFAPALSGTDLPAVVARVEAAVTEAGLKFEWSGNRHIAIDLPPGGKINEVWNAIAVPVAAKQAYWEWADVEEFRV